MNNIPVAVINTPRAVTNISNTVIWQWLGDPFGTTLADTDPDNDGVNFNFNLRFAGQYYDAESGLHYNYFRDYNPATGRYIEPDPIGLRGGLNTYGYVGGNPVSRIDSEGLSDTGATPIFIPFPTIIPSTTNSGNTSSNDYTPDGRGRDGDDRGRPDRSNRCSPECDPPEGTICYESWHDNHPHKGVQPHRHTWQQNKIPGKGCQWNKRRDKKHTLGIEDIIPNDMKACESYSSWNAQPKFD